jgi:hypothetical protein
MARGRGRPNLYETEIKDKLILVEGWARDGLTNEQIAENLGIHVSTLCEYQNKYPEFKEALKNGKEVIDFQVENALLKKAMEGDTTAQIFWLKNRRSDKWRDRRDHNHEATVTNKNIDMSKFSKEELLKISNEVDADE